MKNFEKYSDKELTKLINEGRREADGAFVALYNRYSEQLNAYCIFKAGNKSDAEEIFQDTWLKFLKSARDGKKIDTVLPFIYTIARHLCIDRFRSKKSNTYISNSLEGLEKLSDAFNLQTQIEKDDLISIITLGVNNLDDIYKETFVMHWFGGMPVNEIAEILGENAGTIKMRGYRAMKELIRILNPYVVEISGENRK